MTDAEFWSLIDRSREHAGGSPKRQSARLRRLLREECSADDVAEFSVRFDNLIRKAYTWDLWGAAYVIGGGCSDDGFWDFRSWLVSRGKRVYRAALRNPQSLVRVVGRDEKDRSWKSFLNLASFVWADKTGRDFCDCPGLGSNLGHTPTGRAWDDDELPERYPRLWKAFGRKPQSGQP